jgi:sporulation protein YlmC with PRC-barrel domain
MELTGDPAAFSDLVGRRVCDSAGHTLGHVFEARAHWERDGSIVVDELLVGRQGLWRRLRGPGDDDRGIPWEAVIALDDDHIGVRV